MELEDPIRSFKAAQAAEVAVLKERLVKWIKANDGSSASGVRGHAPNSVSVTAALLETAIDRQIELLGSGDALDLITRCFQRRLAAYRKTLQ